MYVLLSFVGLIFGILFGMAVNLIFSQSTESAQLFICISISMALISGSVLMPFYFIFDETKVSWAPSWPILRQAAFLRR